MSKAHPSLLVFLLDDSVRGVRAVYEKVDEVEMQAPAPMAYGQEAEKRAQKLRGYLFKTTDQTLAVGDLCVVPTDTRHGFTVVKLVEVDAEPDMDSQLEHKWIVGKVDVSQYFETKAQEQRILDKVAKQELRVKKEELRKTLLGAQADDFANMKLAIAQDAGVAKAEVELLAEAEAETMGGHEAPPC